MKRFATTLLALVLFALPGGLALAQLPPPPVNLAAHVNGQATPGVMLNWQHA